MPNVNAGADGATERREGSGRIGQGRAGGNLLIFLIASVLAFALVTPTPPLPDQFRQKMDLMAAQEDIDTVFIGSSRTHFQFVPKAFDAESNRMGKSVRSFNLGLVGAFGHEIDYLLERHVLPAVDVRYILIEFRGFEYQCPDQRERTFREIYWHDTRRTLDSISTTMKSHLGPLRWAEVQDDLMHFGLRFIGRWPDRRGPVSKTDSRGYTEWLLDGDQNAPEVIGEMQYDGNLVVNTSALLRQQARLHALGIEVFYVLPPGAPRFRELERLEAAGQVKHVIRLNDPARYPELFDSGIKGSLYLLREGADRYSQRVARAFCETSEAAVHSERQVTGSDF